MKRVHIKRIVPLPIFVSMLLSMPLFAPQQALGQWSTISFVDAFGDTTGHGAVSPRSGSIRAMSFPYGNVTASIIVDCDQAWIRFDDSPNLVGGDFIGSNGWQSYSILVRFNGGAAEQYSVSQSPGGNDLYFNDGRIASLIATGSSSTIAVALQWYGEGSAAFEWSLTGASDAINDSCPSLFAAPLRGDSGSSSNEQGPRRLDLVCGARPGKVDIPLGDEATLNEMLAAQSSVKDFTATMEQYLTCIYSRIETMGKEATELDRELLVNEYNSAETQMKEVAAEFNEARQLFQDTAAAEN